MRGEEKITRALNMQRRRRRLENFPFRPPLSHLFLPLSLSLNPHYNSAPRAAALSSSTASIAATPLFRCAGPVSSSRPSSSNRGASIVRAALSRKGKEETLEKLADAFSSSAVVFGVRFRGVSVKEVEGLRRALPPSAKMVVCKNTLLRLAAERAGEGWEEVRPATSLENAWVFADEEAISGSVKAYLDFEKKLLEPIPKEERAAANVTAISGAVFEGKFLDGKEAKKLATMPTKQELMQRIAVMIKKVPTKLAVSINAVPRKVALGVKALADGDDDKTKLVGDVFPKAA
jgi:large subunit ribosomal protein L10